jgi:hypothetical protein
MQPERRSLRALASLFAILSCCLPYFFDILLFLTFSLYYLACEARIFFALQTLSLSLIYGIIGA